MKVKRLIKILKAVLETEGNLEVKFPENEALISHSYPGNFKDIDVLIFAKDGFGTPGTYVMIVKE